MLLRAVWLLAALLAAPPLAAQGLQPVPALEARVTDLTGTLTAAAAGGSRAEARRFRAAQGLAGRLADGGFHPA